MTKQSRYADENYVLSQIRTQSHLKFKSHYPLEEIRLPADSLNIFDQCCMVSGATYCVLRSFCGTENGVRCMLIGYIKERQSKIDTATKLMKKYSF